MKTKTITALERALADMGCTEARRPDEFTSAEMHREIGDSISPSTVERRLRALTETCKYSRRRLGKDYLYRAIDKPATKR